jgi:hypothetical protein
MTDEVDEWGDPIVSHTLLIYFNAHSAEVEVTFPTNTVEQGTWEKILDTADPLGPIKPFTEEQFIMPSRSIVVFRHAMEDDDNL